MRQDALTFKHLETVRLRVECDARAVFSMFCADIIVPGAFVHVVVVVVVAAAAAAAEVQRGRLARHCTIEEMDRPHHFDM